MFPVLIPVLHVNLCQILISNDQGFSNFYVDGNSPLASREEPYVLMLSNRSEVRKKYLYYCLGTIFLIGIKHRHGLVN